MAMSLDASLTQAINALSGRSKVIDAIMVGATVAGPYVMVGLIAIHWWSKNNRDIERHLAIRCGLATTLGLLLNQGILLFVQRARPYESGVTQLLVQKSGDPSFPSDHATVAFAITVTVLFYRPRRFWLFFIIGLLTCISRVYVGTHFVTDVLGGALVGAVASFVVRRIYVWFNPVTQKVVRIF